MKWDKVVRGHTFMYSKKLTMSIRHPRCLYQECHNSNHSNKLYIPSSMVAHVDKHFWARVTWYLMSASSILFTSLSSLQSCFCWCCNEGLMCFVLVYANWWTQKEGCMFTTLDRNIWVIISIYLLHGNPIILGMVCHAFLKGCTRDTHSPLLQN